MLDIRRKEWMPLSCHDMVEDLHFTTIYREDHFDGKLSVRIGIAAHGSSFCIRCLMPSQKSVPAGKPGAEGEDLSQRLRNVEPQNYVTFRRRPVFEAPARDAVKANPGGVAGDQVPPAEHETKEFAALDAFNPLYRLALLKVVEHELTAVARPQEPPIGIEG